MTQRELPSHTPNLKVIEVQPGGLTANEVARRALRVSPSVRQKIEQVKSANERIEQTTISFLPHLTLQASYLRTSPINAGLGPQFRRNDSGGYDPWSEADSS